MNPLTQLKCTELFPCFHFPVHCIRTIVKQHQQFHRIVFTRTVDQPIRREKKKKNGPKQTNDENKVQLMKITAQSPNENVVRYGTAYEITLIADHHRSYGFVCNSIIC